MRGRPRGTRKIYTNDFIDTVIHLYTVDKKSYPVISKECHISASTIHDILASHGVHIRHQKRMDKTEGTVCGSCHQFKPLTEFYKWHTRNGYMADCKTCAKIKRDYYRSHRNNLSPQAKAKLKGRTMALTAARNLGIKRDVLSYYGNGKCACVKCGFDDIRALSIDHINGRGNTQRRDDKIGSNMYRWLKRHEFPSGYQTLCMNCQFIKADSEHERLRQYPHDPSPKTDYNRTCQKLLIHIPINTAATKEPV